MCFQPTCLSGNDALKLTDVNVGIMDSCAGKSIFTTTRKVLGYSGARENEDMAQHYLW